MPFTSYPSAIRRFLQYWLGYKYHEDWKTLTPERMSEEIFEDDTYGWEIVDGVFNLIVRLLWRHRETVLRPAQKILPLMPPVKTSSSRTASSSEDPEFHAQLMTQGITWLRSWLKAIAKSYKINSGDVTPRLNHTIPADIAKSIDEWELETGETRMRPIFEAMECAVTNFLMSPTGPTNNPAHLQNQLRFLTDEINYYENQLLPTLDAVTPVVTLYTEIVQLIRGFPQLQHAPFWTQIPLKQDGPREIDERDHTKVLIRKNRTERTVIFNKALASFIKRISQPDCMGVPVDNEDAQANPESRRKVSSKLHLAFTNDIGSMVDKAKLISHHLGVISESPNLTEWPVIEEQWNDIPPIKTPIALPICTINDLQVHYLSEDVWKVQNEENGETGGTRVEEDAANSQFGLLAGPSHKRGHSTDRSDADTHRTKRRRAAHEGSE
jgi:hypothetical protein